MNSYSQGGIDPQILSNFNRSVEGLSLSDMKLWTFPCLIFLLLAAYYIINFAEISSNMARYDGVKFGSLKEGSNLLDDYLLTRGELLGVEVRRRIMLGTYVLSSGYYDAFYNKANIARDVLKNDFAEIFSMVDIVLTPTSPSLPFKIGEKSDNPMEMYLADIFTVTQNLVGIPAISIPSGTVEVEGKILPLGIQFSASHHNEEILFKVGKEFEKLLK